MTAMFATGLNPELSVPATTHSRYFVLLIHFLQVNTKLCIMFVDFYFINTKKPIEVTGCAHHQWAVRFGTSWRRSGHGLKAKSGLLLTWYHWLTMVSSNYICLKTLQLTLINACLLRCSWTFADLRPQVLSFNLGRILSLWKSESSSEGYPDIWIQFLSFFSCKKPESSKVIMLGFCIPGESPLRCQCKSDCLLQLWVLLSVSCHVFSPLWILHYCRNDNHTPPHWKRTFPFSLSYHTLLILSKKKYFATSST